MTKGLHMRRRWCRLSLLSLVALTASSVACSRETGATGLSTALEQEANRIRLLSEFRGSVEYLPSGESYWVAFVPPATNLPPQLNSDLPVMAGGASPASACAPIPGEALVV